MQEGADGHVERRAIKNVAFDKSSDIVIGVLEDPHDDCKSCLDHPSVGISTLAPVPEDIVGTYIFPHTTTERIGSTEIDGEIVKGQHIVRSGKWEIGEIEEDLPDGDILQRSPAFKSTIFLESGGSGGPIFNSKGLVVAINSSSGKDSGIYEVQSSIGTLLSNVLDLRLGDTNVSELLADIEEKPIITVTRKKQLGLNVLNSVVQRYSWPSFFGKSHKD